MDIDEKLKAIFEYVKKADAGDLTEREIADKERLPDGCSYESWLNDIEAYAKTLPDDLPRVDAIRVNAPRAREALADGRTSDLHLFIHRLDEAYTDIIRNRMGERGFKAEQACRKPAWYTGPLIAMCRTIRQWHQFYTAEEMFNALPSAATISPIHKIKRNEDEDFDSLTIESNSHHHDKILELKTFQTFCSKHRDEIGKKII